MLNLTKTQRATWQGMLDCGVRAFDFRPALVTSESQDEVWFHHGVIPIPVKFEDSVREILEWSMRDTNQNSLVLLYVNKCADLRSGQPYTEASEKCWSRVRDILYKTFQLNSIVPSSNCFEKYPRYNDSVALAQAPFRHGMKLTGTDSRLDQLGTSARGHTANGRAPTVLVVEEGCVEENFDPSITCFGKVASTGEQFVCYDSPTRDLAFAPFEAYAIATTDNSTLAASALESERRTQTRVQRSPYTLRMIQAHWQTSTESAIISMALNSSVLYADEASQIQATLVAGISEGLYKELNLIETDDSCQRAPQIADALTRHYRP